LVALCSSFAGRYDKKVVVAVSLCVSLPLPVNLPRQIRLALSYMTKAGLCAVRVV
jgi:hypothetical protein